MNDTKRAKQDSLETVMHELNKHGGPMQHQGSSPLSTMIKLLRGASTAPDAQVAMDSLLDLLQKNELMRGLSIDQLDAFSMMRASHKWLRRDMLIVFDKISRNDLNVDVFNYWVLSDVFHRLYGLPKAFIYSGIILRWTTEFTVINLSPTLDELMKWCLSRNVIIALNQPESRMAAWAIDAWSSVATEARDSIVDKQTFHLTVRYFSSNLSVLRASKSMWSLRDIVEASKNPLDSYVANVLYPKMFAPREVPINASGIVHAISMVLKGGGTLYEVQTVYPYSPSASQKYLMADIARTAAEVGRLDVAQTYGYGPKLLDFIDMSPVGGRTARDSSGISTHSVYYSWRIDNFVNSMPYKENALQILGFDGTQIAQILGSA